MDGDKAALGSARQLAGNVEGARMEWEAAERAFDACGAVGWADRASQASSRIDGPNRTTSPEMLANSVFRCEADIRQMGFDGPTALISDHTKQ